MNIDKILLSFPYRIKIIEFINRWRCLFTVLWISIANRKKEYSRSLGPAGKILILSPHMDDETIGCGGIIRKYALKDCPVACVYLTDGAYGLSDRKREELRNTRISETRAVASFLGIQSLYFLNQPDGFLDVTPELVSELRAIMCREAPDHIYLPYPFDPHRDHKKLFEIFTRAAEGLERDEVQVFFYQIRVPIPREEISMVVDISDVLAIKKEALGLYKSQSHFPFPLLLHLQRCQAFLAGFNVKAVEVFSHIESGQFRKILDRIPLNGVSIQRRRDVGRHALRRKKWP